ncbi:MAG: peptidase S41, partial [Bacteroidales bacterium]|nr:peptidase S41 [Bacteroidales bacterium]
MKKKILLILIAFTALASVRLSAQGEDLNKLVNKYGQLLFYINNYYLDTLNNEKLTDEAIKRVLLQLDPHSSYISAKDVKAMNEPLEGHFEGV